MVSFFPRDELDEILNLIESVSGFPSYSYVVLITSEIFNDNAVEYFLEVLLESFKSLFESLVIYIFCLLLIIL